MKKYSIFIFLILTLLLTACSETNLNTNNNSKEVVSQDDNSTTLIKRPSIERLIQIDNPVNLKESVCI